MNISDNNKYQLIDKYLQGGMSSHELDSFKAFLQSDKDFAADLNIISEMDEAASFESAQLGLKNTLKEIRQNDTVPASPASNNLVLKVAVGLVLLFATFYGIMTLMSSTSDGNNDLGIQQMAMVEPLQLTTKSNASDIDISTMQALFNKGSYAEALPHIDDYLDKKPNDLDVLLAKGIVHYEEGDLTKAHSVFAAMSDLQPRVKKHLWYDALTYIKENKVSKAKVILNEMVANNTYNSKQAQQLLNKLD